jgi:hypothetical protein
MIVVILTIIIRLIKTISTMMMLRRRKGIKLKRGGKEIREKNKS